MGKRIIFRVDDRLIHGQVIEGWIKYYKIKDVIIVSDNIVKDELKKTIYKSIIPDNVSLSFFSLADFKKNFNIKKVKNDLLVLFEDVDTFMKVSDILSDEIYINIGCVANRKHKIEVSDTVYLTKEEILALCNLREKYMVYTKKLPWETSVDIKNFHYLVK
ncbi:PTS sugar transporter subunit IIB [Deferribacter autotrophicus]|uniref:PTS sugar transporter subunit IIB n=1 Tax=Deferribacter autotrophicus TaxID=500465 RepID=A0A5A8F411_9BACT|nr:PTS sugar transporter subunit IIB [Deferribacter autotrophicus]KAA0258201.1 PTS sugar transporter subunit IIB [Deferribacter autotrophicus]